MELIQPQSIQNAPQPVIVPTPSINRGEAVANTQRLIAQEQFNIAQEKEQKWVEQGKTLLAELPKTPYATDIEKATNLFNLGYISQSEFTEYSTIAHKNTDITQQNVIAQEKEQKFQEYLKTVAEGKDLVQTVNINTWWNTRRGSPYGAYNATPNVKLPFQSEYSSGESQGVVGSQQSLEDFAISGARSYYGLGSEDTIKVNGKVIQTSSFTPEQKVIANQVFSGRMAALANYQREQANYQDNVKTEWLVSGRGSWAQPASFVATYQNQMGVTPSNALIDVPKYNISPVQLEAQKAYIGRSNPDIVIDPTQRPVWSSVGAFSTEQNQMSNRVGTITPTVSEQFTFTPSKTVSIIPSSLIGIESGIIDKQPLSPNQLHALSSQGLSDLPQIYGLVNPSGATIRTGLNELINQYNQNLNPEPLNSNRGFQMPTDINPATGKGYSALDITFQNEQLHKTNLTEWYQIGRTGNLTGNESFRNPLNASDWYSYKVYQANTKAADIFSENMYGGVLPTPDILKTPSGQSFLQYGKKWGTELATALPLFGSMFLLTSETLIREPKAIPELMLGGVALTGGSLVKGEVEDPIGTTGSLITQLIAFKALDIAVTKTPEFAGKIPTEKMFGTTFKDIGTGLREISPSEGKISIPSLTTKAMFGDTGTLLKSYLPQEPIGVFPALSYKNAFGNIKPDIINIIGKETGTWQPPLITTNALFGNLKPDIINVIGKFPEGKSLPPFTLENTFGTALPEKPTVNLRSAYSQKVRQDIEFNDYENLMNAGRYDLIDKKYPTQEPTPVSRTKIKPEEFIIPEHLKEKMPSLYERKLINLYREILYVNNPTFMMDLIIKPSKSIGIKPSFEIKSEMIKGDALGYVKSDESSILHIGEGNTPQQTLTTIFHEAGHQSQLKAKTLDVVPSFLKNRNIPVVSDLAFRIGTIIAEARAYKIEAKLTKEFNEMYGTKIKQERLSINDLPYAPEHYIGQKIAPFVSVRTLPQFRFKSVKQDLLPEEWYGKSSGWSPIYSRISYGGAKTDIVFPKPHPTSYSPFPEVEGTPLKREVYPYGRYSKLRDRIVTTGEENIEIPKTRMPKVKTDDGKVFIKKDIMGNLEKRWEQRNIGLDKLAKEQGVMPTKEGMIVLTKLKEPTSKVILKEPEPKTVVIEKIKIKEPEIKTTQKQKSKTPTILIPLIDSNYVEKNLFNTQTQITPFQKAAVKQTQKTQELLFIKLYQDTSLNPIQSTKTSPLSATKTAIDTITSLKPIQETVQRTKQTERQVQIERQISEMFSTQETVQKIKTPLILLDSYKPTKKKIKRKEKTGYSFGFRASPILPINIDVKKGFGKQVKETMRDAAKEFSREMKLSGFKKI